MEHGAFEDGVPLYFAFSVVLSLIFFLVSRFDPSADLLAWAHSFVVQVLASGAVIFYGRTARHGALAFCFFFAMANSVLLLDAAESFRKGRNSGATLGLLVLAGLISTASYVSRDGQAGVIMALTFRAVILFVAAWVLWKTSPVRLVGLRISAYTVQLQGLFNLGCLVGFIYFSRAELPIPRAELAPFAFLLLDVVLALGLVLATTERAREALLFANSQLHTARQELEALADTDPLTGCFNRRAFRALVEQRRAEGEGAGAVFLIDIDDLKVVNDSQGHPAGDRLIRMMAEAVKKRIRTDEMVIRWGGDEFLVVMTGLPATDLESRKREITQSIEDAGLRASVGSARFGPGTDILTAVEKADQAMYAEKKIRKGDRS